MSGAKPFIETAHRGFKAAANPLVQVGVFTAAIFFSALLLFSVQPMFAKMVLPKLGGAPAVWAISMCFFQAVLLAGYCYAHAINRYLSPLRAIQLHLVVLGLTCFALPIGLPADLSEPPAGDAYLWTLATFSVGVGIPFFAVSGNAPLLQAWFARTGHASAHDPYFLYAASNFGSLLALLAYPLVVERTIGLKVQSQLWSAGFIALFGLIVLSAAVMLQMLGARAVVRPSVAVASPRVRSVVTHGQRALWVLLAFVPSGLMIAVTTYISTDLASAPFLWVIPLALFLGTFILVFRDQLSFPVAWLHGALPAAAVTVVLAETVPQYQVLALCAALIGFFVAALICHRELYQRRPSSEHLTEFYIWMSVGGVLGGVFSALLAPKIFTSVFEFKLLLLGAMLFRPGVVLDTQAPLSARRLGAIAATCLLILSGYQWTTSANAAPIVALAPYALAAIAVLALISIRNWPEHSIAIVLIAIAAAAFKPGDLQTVHIERSFFGTHRVAIADDGAVRQLMHGTTVHGLERIKSATGEAAKMPVPATYYHAQGPMAQALQLARRHVRAARAGAPVRMAVVGLGAGSMACHAEPGDTLTFYEIDPAVERIARNPKLFSFLSRCAPGAPVVLGDARLTLAKAAPKSLDYLVIDAFSSDAIPVHLLTSEALAMYFSKLADGAIIALHVSNRHLDLIPSLAATLDPFGGVDRLVVRWSPGAALLDATPSTVVLMSKRSGALDPARAWAGADAMHAAGAAPWSDDFSDMLSTVFANSRR